MTLVLTLSHDPFGFRRQRNGFSQAGLPEVVHPLRVFGVTNHAEFLAFVANDNVPTVNRHNRYVSTWPISFLDHLNGRHLLPFDGFLETWALVNHRQTRQLNALEKVFAVSKLHRAIR